VAKVEAGLFNVLAAASLFLEIKLKRFQGVCHWLILF